jgi:hypothetical protein
MKLRWPFNRLTKGRPVDLINFELKAALLDGGYALCSIDVRGTGTSNHKPLRQRSGFTNLGKLRRELPA